MRQVIVGNSAAALSAIKAIREVDSSCPITLISRERYNAYSPVLLTYYLRGSLSRDDLFIVDSDFYKTMRVETILGSRAIAVDPSQQTVHLENGKIVEHDNLLIATGASPIGLDSPGNSAGNVFSVRTVEDAEGILSCAKTAKSVVVIGGGLIGLQVSDALFKEVGRLTIMEWSGQLLPESIDAKCAGIIQREIESRGISVILGRKVARINKKGKKAVVISDSGEEVTADLVVISIGLRPNIQLVRNSGIEVNRGILVDEQMRTNVKNIFAAGDVSEGENLVTGKKEVLPTWTNACRQGRIAGLNMAGYEQRYEGGIRETIATLFGLTIAAIGKAKTSKDDETELHFYDPDRMSYRKILIANDRIVGAVLLSKTVDVGILGNLIRNRRNILPWKEEIAKVPLDMRKVLLQSTVSGSRS